MIILTNVKANKIQHESKKLRILNQQHVVYKFQSDDYAESQYTLRQVHLRVGEHKNQSSPIGKQYRDKHFIVPKTLKNAFSSFTSVRIISIAWCVKFCKLENLHHRLINIQLNLVRTLLNKLTIYYANLQQAISNHFELEYGVMTAPKRRSILSLNFSCFYFTNPLLLRKCSFIRL